MSVRENKFLIVKPRVRLTPIIIPVIEQGELFFQKHNIIAYVTSGQRTSEDQLTTIKNYLIRYRLDDDYPEAMDCLATDKIDGQYVWQKGWSKLLNVGVIINPPYPAVALYDYWRNGVNKRGMVIAHSPHYFGQAFDIGGGLDHDISNELLVVKDMMESKVNGMKGYLPERKNNCVHIDCIPI